MAGRTNGLPRTPEVLWRSNPAVASRCLCVHYAKTRPEQFLSLEQCGWERNRPRNPDTELVSVRDNALLHIVLSGKGTVMAGGRACSVGPGSMFGFLPFVPRAYMPDPDEPFAYFWTSFDGTACEETLRALGFSEHDFVCEIDLPAVMPFLNDIIGRIAVPDSFLYLSGGVLRLLDALARCERRFETDGGGTAAANPYARQILSWLQAHYAERFTVERMAAELGLSRSYMTRLFHASMGVSLKRYICDYRLALAYTQIGGTALPVQQIGRECGFADPLYFSRAFKKRYGLSPSAYRAALLSEGLRY